MWPEAWTKIGKAAQKREKQEWANEKPELDNARRMRGTYFLDPRQGLARCMAHSPAMLFKQTCHPHFSSFQRLRPTAEFLDRLLRRSHWHALRNDQCDRRPTDQVADLVVEPRPARGSDPSLLASHLNGLWHLICVQEGSALSPRVLWRRTST